MRYSALISGKNMFRKIESKSYTLTMLGTDTVYTPTLKNKKKVRVNRGATVTEYYPKGETLSIVSTLIKTNEAPVIDHKQLAPYQSSEVAIVNGPRTEGSNVGEKIGIGLGLALNALVRGQTELNEIAHSRGGVESILIAHEINSVKEIIASCENFEQLIGRLTSLQTERQKAPPKGQAVNNTPDIIIPLLTQLPKGKEARDQWFNALKANIPNVSMNLFIIDPVPGDVCWPITWYDSRFFTIPPIVKYAEFVYYENEHSDWGFTPIYPEASNPENQVIIRNTLPGHHGTGSAGTNASQQNVVVSPEKTKSTHVQKLMIFKLLKFLTEHGVEFKDAQEIFREHTGLGKKYITFLEGLGEAGIEVAHLDFPAIFRKLYDRIYENRAAYEAFNATHYTLMGVAPQRKVLRTNHKYGLLTEVFPKNKGYVNEEHSFLMKEYFFKILQVHSSEQQSLTGLIKSAQTVLTKNIKRITNLSSSLTEHSITATAILDSEDARKDVLSTFGTLIQRVSQQYLTDDWSTESKQEEKKELFSAIITVFSEFEELLQIDNPTINEFVTALLDLSMKGIIETVDQQHKNLEEELHHLQTPTDTKLKYFFNTLLMRINNDESNSGSEINPLLLTIFESPEFSELANYPVRSKIEYLCEQLKDQLPQKEDSNLVDQLAARFEEQYGDSFSEFEKLYSQIEVFINDISALSERFVKQENVFNKHELTLRKEAQALIDVAAQKFYHDRPNALPEPAEKGSFKELVERHAINKYGVVDRLKQQKALLEIQKAQLSANIHLMEHQIAEKEQAERELNASLEAEKAKKNEYHSALNDEKEAEYLLLINKKLVPLTEEYLSFLEGELSHRPPELELDDEIKAKDEKIKADIAKVTKLHKILTDNVSIPHPKDRLRLFYTKLDKHEKTLVQEHDPDWVCYRRNALIAAGILLSGIVPGLIVLAIYSQIGKTSVKSPLFWHTSGQNAVSSLNQHRKDADIEDINNEALNP